MLLPMAEVVVRTFAITSTSFRVEILDALKKARLPVRRIEIIMSGDYKRRRRSWETNGLPSFQTIREISDFVAEGFANGMDEGMVCLTSDD